MKKLIETHWKVALLMLLAGIAGAGLQLSFEGKLNFVLDQVERFQTLLASLVVVIGSGIVVEIIRSQLQTQANDDRLRSERKVVASALYGEWETNAKFYRNWLGPSLDKEAGWIDIENLPPGPPPSFSFEESTRRDLGILGPHFNASHEVVRKTYDIHRKAAENGAKGFGNASPVIIYLKICHLVVGLKSCAETGDADGVDWG